MKTSEGEAWEIEWTPAIGKQNLSVSVRRGKQHEEDAGEEPSPKKIQSVRERLEVKHTSESSFLLKAHR